MDSTDLNALPSSTSMNSTQAVQNISLQKNEILEKNLESLKLSRDTDMKNIMTGPANISNMTNTQEFQNQSGNSNIVGNGNGGGIGSTSINGNNLDYSVMNQVVSGIQQASINGMTTLRSRDIPMNTNELTSDINTIPNYVPKLPINQHHYISNNVTNDDIINQYNRNQNKNYSHDVIYDELQTPLLISILYFLFQLPIVKFYLFKYVPALFNKDGNNNLFGFIVNSALFGLSYYLIINSLNYISN
jgi:hypothetical protein